MNTWKNAGTPWWRKRWEAALGSVHVLAWTEKGARKRVRKVQKELIKVKNRVKR